MADIGPLLPRNTYQYLFQVPDGLTSTLKAVQSGSGVVSPLKMSTVKLQVVGSLDIGDEGAAAPSSLRVWGTTAWKTLSVNTTGWTFDSRVTATEFAGDGSNLTGLTVGIGGLPPAVALTNVANTFTLGQTMQSLTVSGTVTVSGTTTSVVSGTSGNQFSYTDFTAQSVSGRVYTAASVGTNLPRTGFGAGGTGAGLSTTLGFLGAAAGGGTWLNFSNNVSNTGFHVTHNHGADLLTFTPSGVETLRSNGLRGWTASSTDSNAAPDTTLSRNAVGSLYLANPTTVSGTTELRFNALSSTSTARDQASILSSWADSTDATRRGRLALGAYYLGSLQTGITIDAQVSGAAHITLANGLVFDSTRRIFGSGTIAYQSNANSGSQHRFRNEIGGSFTNGAVVSIDAGSADLGSGAVLLRCVNQAEASVFSVNKLGNLTASGTLTTGAGSAASPAVAIGASSGPGFYNTVGAILWSVSGIASGIFGGAYLGLPSASRFCFSPTSDPTQTPDAALGRVSSNTLGVYTTFNGSALGNLNVANLTAGGTVTATGFISAYTAQTANYTATTTDSTINCTANSFTVTLPTAVGATGRVYNVKNSGVGTITLATTPAQTIDGAASGTITLAQWDNYTLQSDGSNWIVL